jgi:hypothetical protein
MAAMPRSPRETKRNELSWTPPLRNAAPKTRSADPPKRYAVMKSGRAPCVVCVFGVLGMTDDEKFWASCCQWLVFWVDESVNAHRPFDIGHWTLLEPWRGGI